ncbi:MAG TPA: MarR family winged helix-turn-helix transcriptional regulator [Steroidobacteraceae bacterium]|nr:MarR family winged helix-turn-helix transcriptional regulator [Steroidobacteraceae bacterium]
MKSLRDRQHAVNTSGDIRERTAAGDAFSALAILILRGAGHLAAAGDDLARPSGQTSARWQVLAAAENQPVPVAQIARALGLARQSVQRIADVLVQEGLAKYQENPAHRRAKLLWLLPKGRAALRAIQAAQQPWADRLGAEIGETDLRRASAILQRLLRALAETE